MNPLKLTAFGAVAVLLAGCAGRPPAQIAIVQPQDRYLDCLAITAEIEGNNQRITQLGGEQGGKVTQNVVAGIAGLFIPVLWFAMDFQGAASADTMALQSRQQYLGSLAARQCAGGPPVGGPVASTR